MVVIYGHRWYGRAFGRSGSGEGVATHGLHLYYVPLFPIGQMWMTGDRTGIKTRWSWRAMAPVFALQWGLFFGLIFSAASTALGLAIAGGFMALGVASLVSIHRQTKREAAARELTAEVLGLRCPPELLQKELLKTFATRLDDLWGKVSADRPPEDVASLGPRDRGEAALAYTLLSVRASYESGARSKSLRDQANQILAALAKTPELPRGAPYREELHLPEATST